MDEILKYLVESGKIDLKDVEEQIKLKKDREYLEQHQYRIWQGKNGKWYTYLPDKEKGRVQKERKTRYDIEEIVISYYKELEENPTVKDLFYEWINRKIEMQEIEAATYTRYETDFKRCFTTGFSKIKIKDLDELDIEEFMKNAVHEKKMSRKAYSNLRTIMYGMFKYAKKKKYITFNIVDVVQEIEFSQKEFVNTKKEAITQVFFEGEEKTMIDYLLAKKDMVNLGLLLIFVTGLRIGELSTLKWSDIEDNIIVVKRRETHFRNKDTNQWEYDIIESPKTDAGHRRVVVKDDYLWILKKLRTINPFGEYIFMRKGERIVSQAFRNRLRYNCQKTGVVKKSPHKIRKTYGTKLYDSDIPKSLICDQMGHTDISCLEHHYYYNRIGEERVKEVINNLVSL